MHTHITSLKKDTTQGFTLVEFIVIMIIFSIMASVALFNFTGFRSEMMVSNLAHDIALTIRQVQVEGSSSISTVGKSKGIHFDHEGNGEFSNTFVIFNDLNDDGVFNDGEEVDIITINSQDSITILNDNNNNQISEDVHIVFRRPNPTAYIRTGVSGSSPIDSVTIVITAQNDPDRTKEIQVNRSGFIHVVE